MDAEEAHNKINAMLKSSNFFHCGHFKAQMSIESCIVRQHNKKCLEVTECDMGAKIVEDNPQLVEKVQKQAIESKFNIPAGKGLKEFRTTQPKKNAI